MNSLVCFTYPDRPEIAYQSQMKKVIVKKVVYLTIFLLILDLINSLVLNLFKRMAERCDQTIVYANSSRHK